MKNIQDLLISAINNSLEAVGLRDAGEADIILDLPSDSRFGDLSTNVALKLSRRMNKPAPDIAQTLVEEMRQYLGQPPLKGYIKEVKIEGAGFINFYLSPDYFYEQLKNIITKGGPALRVDLGKKRRVLIEFVSANPTGCLSVAHARQAAVGDTLANILDFLGFKVRREYYLNDEGNQINILGESIALRLRQLDGEKIEFPESYYQGQYITDFARRIKEEGLKIKDFSVFGLREILKTIKKELDDFGVKFDYWSSQKKLRQSGEIGRALDFLKEKGFVYEQEGAVWFKSSQFGDDKDRVVVKSDGSYTYLAPDIAYHKEKFKRGFQWLINLWGPDHHGYINRLKAAIEALGKDADSLSVVIVQLATIFRNGVPVQMSTRRGQYITLREVLDEVGLDAARFFFLMRRTSSHLDFDLEVAKKQTAENPVYYVQYAHARICSILRNSGTKVNLKDVDLSVLNQKEEITLVKKICQFPCLLNICLETIDPYMLTVYLQEIAEAFHKFYDKHRVLGQAGLITNARLALLTAAKTAIASGLDLAGVSKPEKM